MRFALVAVLIAACDRGSQAPTPPEKNPGPGAIMADPLRAAPPPHECPDAIRVYEGGRATDQVCPDQLAARGLTVINLSDGWVPTPFSEGSEPGGANAQPYKKTLIALENEQLGPGAEWDRARIDRFLELYGIFPSLKVIRGRLLEVARHQCHEAVSHDVLPHIDRAIEPWRPIRDQQSDKATAKNMLMGLEAQKAKLGVASIDDLANDRYFGTTLERYRKLVAPISAIQVTQAHLRCEGLLGTRTEDGISDAATTAALQAFHRKNMIVTPGLDKESREALDTDSRELDFRTLLRVLRERVVDATGLIEDGTARNEPGQVIGRVLDGEALRKTTRPPLENGAPDLVAAATDAAARALGWVSPEAATQALTAMGPDVTKSLRVAVSLPAIPSYHSASMDLRAEIDRGDVWYDFPYTPTGEATAFPEEHRPTLVLYAKDGGRDVALVRWPTTIGSWKPQRMGPRKVEMVYKDSTPGPRVWRDLTVTPVWIPPDNAPRRELVRKRPGGEWVVNNDLFGPGYASAYGLLKLEHLRVAKMQNTASPPLVDEGIGTHGSVSYDSIARGHSHGCHRLHNYMALRLGSFLLHHRAWERKGNVHVGYGRRFKYEGNTLQMSFDSSGYRYELTPPVAVEVLPGRIMSHQTSAPTHARPLPAALLEQFTQERFED